MAGVAEQLQRQEIVIRETVTCIKADRDEMAAIVAKTQELITVVDDQIRVLGNIIETLQNLSDVQFELQIKVSLESVLSFLEALSMRLVNMNKYIGIRETFRKLDI